MIEIENVKKMWATFTNTDCTEGRGQEYAFCFSEMKATILRLCHRIGVQGCDGRVEQVDCYLIDGTWYYPHARVERATREDETKEVEIVAEAEKKRKKEALLQKLFDAGITVGELDLLR